MYVFVSVYVGFLLACVLRLTDLKSSEDTVCVYVVLGADEHGWRRRGYGVTVIAGRMAAVGQEQN